MPRPLSALLSHAYVAYAIEADNEAEHQTPHRTARSGGRGPWLTSSAMWFNCLRFVNDAGIPIDELLDKALTPTNLHGMTRWGYITVNDRRVRLTPKGKLGRDAWPRFLNIVEARWRERFGNTKIDEFRESLVSISASFGRALPDVMPILGAELRIAGRVRDAKRPAPSKRELDELTLLSLLAKPLAVIGILFERESDVALAISANVLNAIGQTARLRDVPALSGVSKEAIAMALTVLTKQRYVTVWTNDRVRMAALTPEGETERKRCVKLLADVERKLAEKYGAAFDRLRNALVTIVDPETTPQALQAGLEPYPDNWRAKVPRLQHLPDFPMILHRGGYPDGS